jgi:hypothetical protein
MDWQTNAKGSLSSEAVHGPSEYVKSAVEGQMSAIADEVKMARWLSYSLAALNVIFAIAVITTIPMEGLFPSIGYLVIAVLVTIVSIHPHSYQSIYRILQNRWLALGPIVWFIVTYFIYDGLSTAYPQPHFWSAVQVWQATIFWWLGLSWLILYARRTFVFDRPRRFAWLTFASLTVVIGVLSLAIPLLVAPPTPTYWSDVANQPNTYLKYSAQLNTDSYGYAPVVTDFPFAWKQAAAIHRPTFFAPASQLCIIMDALRQGYTRGVRPCTLMHSVFSILLVNCLIGLFGSIVIYELVRMHLKSAYAAWVAGVLITLSGYYLWYICIASSDFSETLIACASLWMLHVLFTSSRPSTGLILVCGILFGFLLLDKLQMTYIIFGLLLMVVLRRWRLLAAVAVMPVIVWFLYTRFIAVITPYQIIETGGGWKTVNWIATDLIHYTPFQMARSVTKTFALFTDKTMLFFGILVIIAAISAIVNPKFPQYAKLLCVGIVLSSVAFAWVFSFSYFNHVLGLIPFVYGAVGLGIEQLQNYIRLRFSWNQRLSTGLSLTVLLLPVLHNLAQWGALDIPLRINWNF